MASTDYVSLWLADFHLLAGLLLTVVLACLWQLTQPAQRMALVRAALIALTLLLGLTALPGWSLLHMSPAQRAGASPPPAIERPAPLPATDFRPADEPFTTPPITMAAPTAAAIDAPQPAVARPATEFGWDQWLLTVYAAGSLLVLAWLAVGSLLASRVRRATMAAPAELQNLLAAVAGKSTNLPALLVSDRIAAPVALGVRRPAILLPAAMLQPSLRAAHDELAAVLAHEWSHLRNGDLRTLATSRLLLVLLWPQPLFWLLRRTLRLDQETLADADAAELAGRVPYAERLLGWARQMNDAGAPGAPGAGTPRLAGAVGLWEGPSQLKRRIATLLDERLTILRECSPRWRWTCGALLAAAAIGLSLITSQPATEASAEPPAESPISVSPDAPAEREPAAKVADDRQPRPQVTISGRIVLEDGSPTLAKGWLYSNSTTSSPSHTTGSTEGNFADSFSITVPRGVVWLKHFVNGYAPAWVGPLDATARDRIDDVTIILKPGISARLVVVDERDQPVSGATLRLTPVIGDDADGPVNDQRLDAQGRITVEHLAEVPYMITLTAPGFEPLRLRRTEAFAADSETRLVMQRSRPASGVVVNADGSPSRGAKLLLFAASKGGLGGIDGDLKATTDEEGRFTLDELSRDARYLFVVETADGARTVVNDVVAGAKDLRIQVPPRRDLKVHVVGNLDDLPKRNGQPFVSVRQRIELRHGVHYTTLVGDDMPVSPTRGGGEFTYQGLVEGDVELVAGDRRFPITPSENPLTETAIELSDKSPDDDGKPAATENEPATRLFIQGPATVNAFRAGPPSEPPVFKKNALGVQAIDGDGAPIEGVEALLYRASFQDGSHELISTATTDAQGEVEFADLVPAADVAEYERIEQAKEFPPQSMPYFLVALRKPGLSTTMVNHSSSDVALRGARKSVILRPAGELRGTVVDQNGAPVAGAMVAAGGLSGMLAIEGVNAVKTDVQGRYVFTDRARFSAKDARERMQGVQLATLRSRQSPDDDVVFKPLDPGEDLAVTQLTVRHPDFAVATVQGGDVPGTTDVQLAPAAAIAGRVIHFDTGQPAAGVKVTAAGRLPVSDDPGSSPMSFPSLHNATTRTDTEGRYRLSNLPAASYDVWAQPDVYAWSDAEWVCRGVSGVNAEPGGQAAAAPDLEIGPGGVLRVQLVDDAGQPLEVGGDRPFAVLHQRLVDGPLQSSPVQRPPVSSDGRVDVRVLPGKSRVGVFVTLNGDERYGGGDYRTRDGIEFDGPVFDVGHGQRIEAEFPVYPAAVLEERRAERAKGFELLQAGKLEEAVAAFDAVLAAYPDEQSPRFGRANALDKLGRVAEAIADYETLLANSSNDPVPLNNLASLLATASDDKLRDGSRAVELAERAIARIREMPERQASLPAVLDTLASAHAETGDFDKAIATAEEALKHASEKQQAEMQSRLDLYRAGKPYRRAAPAEK